ncbi:Sister chromatid cohesion protein DCC1 [Cryptotermes secundus]|uniref:Sister chromatid cohesion protein DCC1 n=1 Tax=Cryptotermes secundus TaxID=105785 RepID=A0A2J7PMJ7_9NEOP|nr:sister chromatid cohesion protein DCC1 isoform X1 [Cryptotermes secundus]PNF17560.1 Sister chromatid cohesion protein DCC1 [Cryptotermes secundus]
MAGISSYCRTVEDVQTVIQHAKLFEGDLQPLSQVLSFVPRTEAQGKYRFLELDPTLLSNLQRGQSLVFRGTRGENAVLCTHNRTYDVKEAETSNSLLLVPDLRWPAQNVDEAGRMLEEKQVLGVFHKYYELRTCKPRLRKVRQLLEECLYRGPEYEDYIAQSGIKLYTFQDLLENVQASEEELRTELKENLACCINGAWRFLEHEYHFRVLSYILNFVDENSWPIDKINKTETLQSLAALVPMDVLEQCFSWYAEETVTVDKDGETLYRLLEERICRFLAEVLLRQAGKFNLKDFLSSWQQSVPEGMQTTEKYLEGIALMDKNSKPEVIWYFPETDLPEDISERIRILFQTRDKWTLDEIRPYIQRLATEKLNVNALLTKHARASSVSGVRYYSAKHAK